MRQMTPNLADCIEAGKALDADERLEAAHYSCSVCTATLT